MKMFIDTEFNKDELISMAIFAENGEYFYEVLPFFKNNCQIWVIKNVLNKLEKSPIDSSLFKEKLINFLLKFDKIELISDNVIDLYHFFDRIKSSDGFQHELPEISTLIINKRKIKKNLITPSDNPHNALSDAISNFETYLNIQFEDK